MSQPLIPQLAKHSLQYTSYSARFAVHILQCTAGPWRRRGSAQRRSSAAQGLPALGHSCRNALAQRMYAISERTAQRTSSRRFSVHGTNRLGRSCFERARACSFPPASASAWSSRTRVAQTRSSRRFDVGTTYEFGRRRGAAAVVGGVRPYSALPLERPLEAPLEVPAGRLAEVERKGSERHSERRRACIDTGSVFALRGVAPYAEPIADAEMMTPEPEKPPTHEAAGGAGRAEAGREARVMSRGDMADMLRSAWAEPLDARGLDIIGSNDSQCVRSGGLGRSAASPSEAPSSSGTAADTPRPSYARVLK